MDTFEVGDIVSFGGLEGKIICEFGDGNVRAQFIVGNNILNKMSYQQDFINDGRFALYHTEPTLKLISKVAKPCKHTDVTITEGFLQTLMCRKCREIVRPSGGWEVVE